MTNVALRIGGDVLFVRHHDDCDAALVELLKDCHDLDAGAAVEIAGRLVGKRRLSGSLIKRASDRDAAVAGRQKAGWDDDLRDQPSPTDAKNAICFFAKLRVR